MSYCSNCGGRLNDNGCCPNCGGVSEAKIVPEEKEIPEVFACLKALFSESPLKGVERAARTQSPSVWVVFGAIFFITTVIAQLAVYTSLPPNTLHGLLDRNMARMLEFAGPNTPPEKLMPAFAELFGYAALMALIVLVVATVMTALIFVLAEERPTVTQALNITTFATLPISVCSLLALPMSLLSVPFSAGILLLGFAASVVMYYFGIQKASQFNKSPFWLFVLALFIGELVVALFSLIFTMLLF